MVRQELESHLPEPGINEVNLERKFASLLDFVQAEIDFVGLRFPEVKPKKRVTDIFHLVTKEEMFATALAEQDSLYHPSISRETLAKNCRVFVDRHQALASVDRRVLININSLAREKRGFLRDLFLHELGHLVGGEIKYHQEPPHETIFPWPEYVRERIVNSLFSESCIPHKTPVCCGHKGFYLFAHTDENQLLISEETSGLLEEVRAHFYSLFFMAQFHSTYKGISPERYLQGLLANSRGKEKHRFAVALTDYMLEYGLEKIIKSVTLGDLNNFVRVGNNRLKGRKRNIKRLRELSHLLETSRLA